MRKVIQSKKILKIPKRLTLIFLSSITFIFNVVGQNTIRQLNENDATYEHIYNAVIRNITFCHTQKHYPKYKDNPGSFFDNVDEFGTCPIPSRGMSYNMSIENIQNDAIDSSLVLYSFVIDNMGYVKYKDINKQNAKILHLFGRPNINGDKFFLNNQLQSKGLIGFYKYNNSFSSSIIFISGEMILNDIKKLLFNGKLNLKNIKQYVLLRYYNYEPEKLTIQMRNDAFETSFYSKSISTMVKVLISKKSIPDIVQIVN